MSRSYRDPELVPFDSADLQQVWELSICQAGDEVIARTLNFRVTDWLSLKKAHPEVHAEIEHGQEIGREFIRLVRLIQRRRGK